MRAYSHVDIRIPPTSGVTGDGYQYPDLEVGRRRVAGADREAVKFATVQLLVGIYPQKFALGPLSFQVSLPILSMFGHLCLMLISGRIQFAPLRLGCYLLFASSCL